MTSQSDNGGEGNSLVEASRKAPSNASTDSGPDPAVIRERVRQGVQLCRSGRMEEGYRVLRGVTQEVVPNREFPGSFFSYLGYGIAAFEARYNDGIALCKRAIEMEFYNPDNHHNLARTYMLLGTRRKAVEALHAGLRIDPQDPALRRMVKELGTRKKPVLPFWDRDHPLNRFLGKARHVLGAKPESSGTRRRKAANGEGD